MFYARTVNKKASGTINPEALIQLMKQKRLFLYFFGPVYKKPAIGQNDGVGLF